MSRFAFVILAAWAGSLWTICGLVVPLLFTALDRQLAGNIAAIFFHAEVALGTVLGVLFLILKYRGPALERRTALIAGATIVAPLIFYVVLRPMMNTARAAGDMARFGVLHSAAGGLFLLACVGALLLVVREAPPSRREWE